MKMWGRGICSYFYKVRFEYGSNFTLRSPNYNTVENGKFILVIVKIFPCEITIIMI